MRNWLKLRPASFRGVPFHVEDDGPMRGRRVVVHDISGGERPLTEDMGRMATAISVSAYVATDAADAIGHVLERACDAPGPALLVLPIDPARMMHCIGCERERRKDRAGYIAYRLSFVEAGAGASASIGGISALRDIFDAGIVFVSGAIGSLFK
ncbi:DNA circularization N-terminal domain-containing protein [Mesorhizobium sp. 1M-11]|uniref:DNA circularization N-terminal domain-containing protein n=1 Tax=Mesorhizobium sp. 1M-11 TaxID=1529006 RepID=UPI0006C73A5E|nr:DNA circularization N-terminal domain-containing protein [Mesorhizobium sp. 1M-11]